MGAMKRQFEKEVPNLTDEQLKKMGYDEDEIKVLREFFPKETEKEVRH